MSCPRLKTSPYAICSLLAIAAGSAFGAAGATARDVERSAGRWITPWSEKAVAGGLTWLAQRQNEDGSYGSGAARGNVGICALAGMAFLSAGSTPGRGAFAKNVDRCLDYTLAQAQANGLINGPDTAVHGPMFKHGFATLFLAEYYGHYYAAQAMWQAGGGRFERWFPAVRDDLIARQAGDGSWPATGEGDECATAMACLVLQTPNNYLPIQQR